MCTCSVMSVSQCNQRTEQTCTKWHCVYKCLKVVASLQLGCNHEQWLTLPVCYWYLTKINSCCTLQEQQCGNIINGTFQSRFSYQKGYKMHMEMM